MSFCTSCGNHLEEGEVCVCLSQKTKDETSATLQQNFEQSYGESYSLKDVIPSIINFFTHPATAVREAIRSNSWKNGLVFMLIYILCTGLLGTFSYVSYELKSYNSDIKSAQKYYDELKEKYKNQSSDYNKSYYEQSMNDAKENLNDAKKDKSELLRSGDFYEGIFKSFWNLIINPILFLALVIFTLLIIGKVFNGNGSLQSIVAGVGMSANIYLISALVIPLFAKIPKMGFLYMIAPIVTYIFVLLVYIAFDEIFGFDEDKAVFAVIITFVVATLICGLMLKDTIASSSLDQLDSMLDMFR